MQVKELAPYIANGAASAHCMTFENKNGGITCIVTVREELDEKPLPAVLALIAHEAVHVWQQFREHLGEEKPSAEFEAYSIHHFCLHLFDAYVKTRRPQ